MTLPDGLADGGLVCRACGQIHEDARLVVLPDGRRVGNYSEEYRRYNEAKWVFRKYRSKNTRRGYLSRVAEKRGEAAMQELRQEMWLVWKWKEGQKK